MNVAILSQADSNYRFEPETLKWIKNVKAASGVLTGTTIIAWDIYLKKGKAQGWITKKKLIVPLAKHTKIAAAIIPLINTLNKTTVNQGMADSDCTAFGVKRNTAGTYIDLGIKPADLGTTNICISAYLYDGFVQSNTSTPIGVGDAGNTNRHYIDCVDGSTQVRAFVGGTSSNAAVMSAGYTTKGRISSDRSSNTRLDLYVNGSSTANYTTSVTPTQPNFTFWAFTENQAGGTLNSMTAKTLCEVSVGVSMTATEHAQENAALEACMKSIGCGVQ